MMSDIAILPDKLSTFSSDVRTFCREKQMEYIDAVVHWCEINSVEVELAAGLVRMDPMMMSMIQTEAENLNIIKKTAKLPV